MPPVHFSITQVRAAASCPRILYFDAEYARRRGLQQPTVTRIWKAGLEDETTACGSLFHAAIEKFNGHAATDPAIREVLGSAEDAKALAEGLLRHVYWNYVDQDKLFAKSGAQQAAFMGALRHYLSELADILAFARAQGQSAAEILEPLFGDRRRRVDVTFQVGPAGEPVHVTGILDYVFYDWRAGRHRILDYKLTPAQQPSNDLFQVCVYALMHHVQHRTGPDAGVLYLHPTRHLAELSWEQVHGQRHVIFNLLASMREWIAYDERTGQGLKPPGDPQYCASCRWKDECSARLGPKNEGQRLEHWLPGAPGQLALEPSIAVREPPVGLEAPNQVSDQRQALEGHAPATPLAALGPQAVATEELWIGHTTADTRPVGIPVQALPTHITIVGAAGSGKTWLAKILVEEAILQGVPVLAIDPQGDLVQFLRPRADATLTGAERRHRERFLERVEPRVFTPGSSHGIRISLSPIRLAGVHNLAAIPDPQRRAEEFEGVLTSVAGNLVNAAKAGGEADCQQTFLLQVLKQLTEGQEVSQLSLTDVVAAVNKPETAGIKDPDTFVRKAERTKLARKLNNLLRGSMANLFSGGMPVDLDRLCQPVQTGKVPLNVIYLNALPEDEHKQLFVAALAVEIYRWMVTTVRTGGGPSLLFYLDEARDYIPAGAHKPPAKPPLLRLFTQGRKFGVACLLCTQSPRSVDYNVFGNCSTKLIGRLESAQDSERVAEWFATQGPKPAWLRDRAGAEAGTFIARWPDMPGELEGQTIKSRSLFSLHEGAWAPERVEQEMRLDPVRQVLMDEARFGKA